MAGMKRSQIAVEETEGVWGRKEPGSVKDRKLPVFSMSQQ